MTPKKALSSYLTKLIKGREKALADGLAISVSALKELAAGNGYPITLAQAITLGNLTDTNPREIMELQLDVDLDNAGVVPRQAVVKAPKPVKPKIRPTGKGATIMPTRTSLSGLSRSSVVR